MKKIFKIWTLILVWAFSAAVSANLALDNISESDLENVISDFTAVFSHSTASPASSLGAIFGMEVGLVGGITRVPGVESIASEVGESIESLPSGGVTLLVSVPLGITIEGSFLPQIALSDGGTFSNTSLGGKWTMTDTLFDWPVDLAVKLSVTSCGLTFNQKVDSVDTKTNFRDQILAFSVLASKNMAVVEPYLGIGYISADGELSVDGAVEIFNFTSSTKATAKPSGVMYYGGVQANLVLLRLGFEVSKVFESTKFLGKLSFYF